MGLIFSLILDGVLKYAFGLLSAYMEKRGLLQQGREQQHTADLEASVKEAKDAIVINEQVRADTDSQLDDALERVRRDASPHP